MKKLLTIIFAMFMFVPFGEASILNVLRGILGTDGTVYQMKMADGKPRVSETCYGQDIAEGNISGITGWSKIGYTPAMTTADNDIWSLGGTYTPPTVSTQMAVVSSDNTNDKAGGTGCLQVIIYALGENYTAFTETVTLNGTSYVNTVSTSIYRVNGFRVFTAGSTGKTAGNISLTNLAHNITYGYITAGFTRGRNSFYTVPAGKVLYITGGSVGYGYSTNQTHYARIYVRVTQNDEVLTPGIFYPAIDFIVSNNTTNAPESIPFRVISKADLKVSGISSFTGIATSYFEGYLK